ncbi:MAG TPA: sodium:solute symporter family protein, partial [Firmicutes bacterium]|nr:sodium:solute symporter family protein [Bacillota bacterium]
MEGLRLAFLIVAGVYLVGMLLVGYFYSGRVKSMDDFATGGRAAGLGLPVVAVAASLLATNNDTGNVLGIPEMTFGGGFGGLFWIVTVCLLVYLLMFLLGPRLRDSAASTLPDYVFRRFGQSTRVRSVVTLWSVVSAIIFMGAQLYGVSVVIQALFGIPWQYSVIPVAGVVIVYTAMGGIWAVAMTDVIQWGLIVLGTAAIVPALYLVEGSLSSVVLAHQPVAGYASLNAGMPIIQLIALSLGASLWVLADPALSQRFLAAQSSGAIKKGIWLWVAIIYPWWLIMAVIGMYARVLFPDIAAAQSLVIMAGHVFHPIIAAIVCTAVLGAAQSTADSYLNVVSSMFVNDIYRPLFKKNGSEAHYLGVARWATIVTGILGVAVAPLYSQGIFVMALNLQMIFISSVVPVVVLGLLWKGINERAAFWASLLGGLTALVWLILGGTQGIGGVQAIYPGLGVALLLILFLSFSGRDDERGLKAARKEKEREVKVA